MSNLLEIKDLTVDLISVRGLVKAVRKVGISVEENQIRGIVGESGCGKSMTIKSIMRLHDKHRADIGGQILFKDKDILQMSTEELMNLRGKQISMIFQDPMVSLNPIMKVGKQLQELLTEKEKISKKEAKERILDMFTKLSITPADKRYEQYPFEMSGGLLQRIVIAMAMICNPELLLADEPTTALDVTTQAQVLQLIKDLQKENRMSVIIVTHNMGVVAEICDVVSVMYAGVVVEDASVTNIFDNPLHPYTKALMDSIVKAGNHGQKLQTIEGTPPKLYLDYVGCPFADRCPKAQEICHTGYPALKEISTGHKVRCHLAAKDKL